MAKALIVHKELRAFMSIGFPLTTQDCLLPLGLTAAGGEAGGSEVRSWQSEKSSSPLL